MTDKETIKRLQEKAQDTDELIDYQEAANELVLFLGKYVPREKMDELQSLLHDHANTASLLGQKMIRIAEEMADEK